MSRPSSAERMASWARRSSNLRSSGENSGREKSPETTAVGLSRGSDIAIRLRRWDGLSATAQNESAAAALDPAPVNFRPEGDKVIDGRHQRDTHHKPDGKISDPVDGENVVAVNRPFLPPVVEDDRNHGYDLHHHFELTELTGFYGEALGGGNRTQAADQKIPPPQHLYVLPPPEPAGGRLV